MRELLSRLRGLVSRQRADAELDEELLAHLEMLADDYVRAGMDRDDAHRRARLRLGGIEQTKEGVRDARATWIDSVTQDLRYGLRTFRRNPGFTAVAVLTLALGVGINSAIFSLADGILFRPLPYRAPDRLVFLRARYAGQPDRLSAVRPADLTEWRRRSRTCEDVAAIGSLWTFRVKSGDLTEKLDGNEVSRNFFDVLGVQPMLGRTFLEQEMRSGAERVAIISSRLWKARFAADPRVLGRSLQNPQGGPLFTVVGVLPDWFQFPTQPGRPVPDAITPLVPTPREQHQAIVSAIARAKAGVTLAAVSADMTAVARQLADEGAPDPRDEPLRVKSVVARNLDAELIVGFRTTFLALFVVVTVLLLIASVNLANLMLARGSSRERELAVRAALGAGRRRLVRQLLTESLLLSLGGGAIGLLLATWLLALLGPFVPERLHLFKDVGIDARQVAYTGLVSIVTAIVFGIAPALRLSRPAVGATLATGPLRPRAPVRIHSWLVFVEVALVLAVLAAGGLVVHSFLRLKLLDPGYDPHRVFALHVYSSPDLVERVLAEVQAIPGVSSAGIADETVLNIGRPLMGRTMKRTSFVLDGRTGDERSTVILATRGYFETMGIRLLKGRPFDARPDAEHGRVAILSESMARRFGLGVDPIGRQLRDRRNPADVRRIVGVVADVRDLALDAPPQATVYLPFDARSDGYGTVVIRTEAQAEAIRRQAIERIRSVDPTAVIDGTAPLNDLLARSIAERTFNTLLFAAFALTALGLCAAGVYGVVSYGVARRTHEIGVRVALGAGRGDVVRMVVRQAMGPVAGGAIAGLAGALVVTRVLRSLLFEVTSTDPATFAAATTTLLAVAAIAALLPARRAAKVDPTSALRAE